MNKKDMKSIEELGTEEVVMVLEKWNMEDFVEFVKEKEIDGHKLTGITEGIVKLWQPKADAKKLTDFIAELKLNPNKYLEFLRENLSTMANINSIVAQYQTVKRKEQNFSSSSANVEEILKKLVPHKSFLYRHQTTKTDKPVSSYVPMDVGTQKKPRRYFRLSSYEYPMFDIKQLRFSRQENFNDRGYYSIKNNSTYHVPRPIKKPESRKYRSLSTAEEIDKCPEDHFYEDLNYNDIDKQQSDLKEPSHGKPRMVKIQELFQSFKLPFFKKSEVEGEKKTENTKSNENEKDGHIYENTNSATSMYDSIHINSQGNEHDLEERAQLPVEDYLEPVQLNKDYCDVAHKQRDDSILGYILSIFDNFGMRRETNDGSPEEEREEVRKCPEMPEVRHMADRPLPIPVENEPYFMNIDRSEAEDLLRGQPDGMFVLRPSSQPNHAYTLTVSCSNAVHNIGVRRRPDGRLALGFARRGERSFTSVTSLLRHHKRRRLLLVAGGGVCGATTLNDTPQYYQKPSNLPVSN